MNYFMIIRAHLLFFVIFCSTRSVADGEMRPTARLVVAAILAEAPSEDRRWQEKLTHSRLTRIEKKRNDYDFDIHEQTALVKESTIHCTTLNVYAFD